MAKKLSRQEKYNRYVERALKRVEQYEKRGWYIDPNYKAKIEARLDIKVRGKTGASASTEMVTRRMFSSKELYKHATLFTDKGTISAKEAREQGYTFTGKRPTPSEEEEIRRREYEEQEKYEFYAVTGKNFYNKIEEKIGGRDRVYSPDSLYALDSVEPLIMNELNSVINNYGYGELGRRVDGEEGELEKILHQMYYKPEQSDVYNGTSRLIALIKGRPLSTAETKNVYYTPMENEAIDDEIYE